MTGRSVKKAPKSAAPKSGLRTRANPQELPNSHLTSQTDTTAQDGPEDDSPVEDPLSRNKVSIAIQAPSVPVVSPPSKTPGPSGVIPECSGLEALTIPLNRAYSSEEAVGIEMIFEQILNTLPPETLIGDIRGMEVSVPDQIAIVRWSKRPRGAECASSSDTDSEILQPAKVQRICGDKRIKVPSRTSGSPPLLVTVPLSVIQKNLDVAGDPVKLVVCYMKAYEVPVRQSLMKKYRFGGAKFA